jgi:hypothetical protein
MICLVLVILVVPIINWTVSEFSWMSRSFMRLEALNLADAGAEDALWEIMHNAEQFTIWGGQNPKTLVLNSFKDSDQVPTGDISVSALNTSPGNYLITSVGYVPSRPADKVKKTVKVKVFPHSLFNNGVFGYDSVSISGTPYINSYNSALGPYNPLLAGSNADVGTNGSMTIAGNSTVKGDLIIGPDGTVSGNDPSHVSGETFYSGTTMEVEPMLLPDYLANLPSQGALSLGGNDDVALLPGYYRYSSISLTSKSILTINGGSQVYVEGSFSIVSQAQVITGSDVSIYIGGSANFAGQGIVNTSGYPASLSIYGLGSDTSLDFSGGSDFFGSVYAPLSYVAMSGNINYYGAVVGNSVDLTGSLGFHYDEALSQSGSSSGYDVAYWQED